MRNARTTALLALAICTLALTGCEMLYMNESRARATTPLVHFLYGQDEVPPQDANVELRLPIRVGLSFLPATDSGSGTIPTAAQREQVLQAVREKFRTLPYVAEIVIIPDYYLDGRRRDGLAQMQQLARLYSLDLYALASYDITSQVTFNKGSVAYLTIVGQFFIPGNNQATHSLVDLAVIEPNSRQLVLRAGGTSSVDGLSAMVDLEKQQYSQVTRSFEKASADMIANFAHELAGFEERVRAGTAPYRVTQRAAGGSGALDAPLLALLAGALGTALLSRRRRAHGRRCFSGDFRRGRQP